MIASYASFANVGCERDVVVLEIDGSRIKGLNNKFAQQGTTEMCLNIELSILVTQ